MKLAILSCSPRAYSTRRLREAAVERGYEVKVLNTLKFAIDVQRGAPALYFRGKQLSSYDAVLPRIGASVTYYGTAVVRQFQEMDVFCANTAHGILNSRDKLRSLQILARHAIGIPRTTFVRDKKDVLPAIERVGGALFDRRHALRRIVFELGQKLARTGSGLTHGVSPSLSRPFDGRPLPAAGVSSVPDGFRSLRTGRLPLAS